MENDIKREKGETFPSERIRKISQLLGDFKSLKRRGWQLRQIKNGESDADHSWGVSLLCLLLAPKNLDLEKCLKLAIIHDLAEIIIGDYVINSIDPVEKHKIETDAMEKIACELDKPELTGLFEEFEAQETAEARFVKEMDKLECVLQAAYYEQQQNSWPDLLSEFANNALEMPLSDWCKDLIRKI